MPKSPKEPVGPNCPFYGYSMIAQSATTVGPVFTLVSSHGNQCGVITGRHSPCYLEAEGKRVEWRECSYIKAIRMEL